MEGLKLLEQGHEGQEGNDGKGSAPSLSDLQPGLSQHWRSQSTFHGESVWLGESRRTACCCAAGCRGAVSTTQVSREPRSTWQSWAVKQRVSVLE